MVKCVNLGDVCLVLEYFALKTLVIFVDLEGILKFEFGQWCLVLEVFGCGIKLFTWIWRLCLVSEFQLLCVLYSIEF